MAKKDPYADLAAKYGVAETSEPAADLDALAAKYGVDAPAAAPAPARVAGIDMGPAARRARAGMASGPRSLTSEEAGTMAGPAATSVSDIVPGLPYARTYQEPEPAALGPNEEVTVRSRHPGRGEGVLGMLGPPKSIHLGPAAGEMTDPGAQMILATAMGKAAAAPLAAIPGRAAVLAGQAVEGGTVNKAQGGDFTTGALIGAGPGALLEGGQAARGAVMEGAPARVAKRIKTNLAEDARKPVADAIEQKSTALNNVIDRNPELRKTLAVSNDKPAKALTAVEKTSAKANAQLDDDFAKMREHYAEQPATVQASVPTMLDDIDKLIAKNKGDIDKTRPLRNARKAIVEEFGYDPANPTSDGIITPDELRSLKRSVGRAAFPPGDLTAAKVKAQVARELYAPIAKQLKFLAENTPGLDVKRFMNANEDVSTLIPVQQALQDKIKRLNEGKKTFGERVQGAAHSAAALGGLAVGAALHNPVAAVAVPVGLGAAKAGARLARGIDYRLAESQLKNEALGRKLSPVSADTLPLSYGLSATEQGRDRGYAAHVVDSLKNGLPLAAAVETAGNRTVLSPAQEKKYQAWKTTLPERLQYEGDYDLRGFFQKNPNFSVDDPEQHMTDEFKLPNHKTFSNESRYYNDKTKHLGGHWEGDVFIPNDTKYKQRVDESAGAD